MRWPVTKTVEVRNSRNELVASYNVEINFMGDEPDDRDFIAQARKNSYEDKLVPDDDLGSLRFAVVPR